MNDPGLEGPVQDTAVNVTHELRERVSSRNKVPNDKQDAHSTREAFRRDLQEGEDEEEIGVSAPELQWWFVSTAFPLVVGTFGPLANLFSICALADTWRVNIVGGESEDQGQRISDPHWLVALNAASLALAVIANILLLFNFARRVRYIIAQPLTISLWYLSSVLLIVPLGLTPSLSVPSDVTKHTLSQSYFYALLSAILYAIMSSLLLIHFIFSMPPFSKYSASFATLTIPQRTLMLQAVSFTLYLAFGAGMFAGLEGWEFCDAVYWADYTLLTIGLGSDFPLQTSAGRGVLIPYAGGGILLIGIVIGSVRALVLERAGMQMMNRQLVKEQNWGIDRVKKHIGNDRRDSDDAMRVELETMRRVARRAEGSSKYRALGISLTCFLALWFLGAMVFFFTESNQNWGYGTSLYFTYVSLLTIGYGDLVPQANASKPFFVLWTLVAVPSVTILISNMGNTVFELVKKGTMWLGQRTILPERSIDTGDDEKKIGLVKGAINKILPLKSPEKVSKAVRAEKAREVEEGAVPPDSDTTNADGGGRSVRGEFDKLGEAVEEVEEGRGQGGGLAARLAREIRFVSKDLGKQPPEEYGWEDWKRWIRLLSEDDSGSGGDGKGGLGSDSNSSVSVALKSSSTTTADSEKHRNGRDHQEEREWIWLGDQGPLFRDESEAKWVLGKLCQKLEKVLAKEHRVKGRAS